MGTKGICVHSEFGTELLNFQSISCNDLKTQDLEYCTYYCGRKNEYFTVLLNQKFHAGIILAAHLEVARDRHNRRN